MKQANDKAIPLAIISLLIGVVGAVIIFSYWPTLWPEGAIKYSPSVRHVLEVAELHPALILQVEDRLSETPDRTRKILLADLKSDRDSRRIAAAQYFRNFVVPEVADAMLAAMEDPNAQVRAWSASNVRSLPKNSLAIARVAFHAEHDEDADVRATCVGTLLLIDPFGQRDLLMKIAKEDPHSGVRNVASRALQK